MKPLPESFLRMLECKPEEFDAVRRSWHRERDAYHSFMQTVDMVCDESKREHQLLSVANNEQFQRMVSERVFEIIRQLLAHDAATSWRFQHAQFAIGNCRALANEVISRTDDLRKSMSELELTVRIAEAINEFPSKEDTRTFSTSTTLVKGGTYHPLSMGFLIQNEDKRRLQTEWLQKVDPSDRAILLLRLRAGRTVDESSRLLALERSVVQERTWKYSDLASLLA